MKPLMEMLQPYIERLKALSMKQRMAMIAGIALLAGVGIWAWAAATATRYATLFSNLEQADAAGIVEKLKDEKILYKLENGGSEIQVPEQLVHETRLKLAGEGLPSGGGVGFELFDEQRFGESEFSEQVKYHRALEGELSRTITHLSGVESARVHLVLPSRSLFASSDNAASASVALRMKGGAKLTRDQTRGIVNLVASSVRGLTAEGVTIVDGSGRRLAGGDQESETVTNSLEFQRNYERSLSNDLQNILDTAVGPGSSVVRVAADVTFAREEVTEERVDPEQVASRSFQIVEERDNASGATAGGVPGAVSTLEGGADPALSGKTGAGITRRSETRNYEVSKTVRKTQEPVGRVTRISVAVAVDGHWKGKGDKRVFTARSAQELATIKSLLISAAGIKDARGDQIAVECVPFAMAHADEVEAAAPKGVEALVKKHWPYAAAAGGVLMLLLASTIMFVLLRKDKKKSEIEKAKDDKIEALKIELERVAPELTVQARDVAAATMGELSEKKDSLLPGPAETKALAEDSQAEAERLRTLTAEIAAGDPYLAARVIRAWLRENNQTPTEKPPTSDEEAAA